MNDLADRLLWKWISSNGGMVQGANPSRLNPSKVRTVWDWIMERDGAGGYKRGPRALMAVRLRSLALRRAGVQAALCADTALGELVAVIGSQELKRVKSPPPRIKIVPTANQGARLRG